MFKRIGRNTYELSGEDLHDEFLRDIHTLREAQEDRKEITTHGFLSGVFTGGTIGVLAIFTTPKIREQVQKSLELQGMDAANATGGVVASSLVAGALVGTAIARATATKYVNEAYERLQHRIEESEMLHPDANEGVRNVVNRMLQTHVILVKSGETPKVIFKPLNWFQRLVIKAQKTRVGKTGLIPAKQRLGTSAKK